VLSKRFSKFLGEAISLLPAPGGGPEQLRVGYSTAGSVLQCIAKTSNCVSAQRWNCAVCCIRAIHSSYSPRDL